MYKLAITTLSTAMFLSAVGYGAARRPSDTTSADTGLPPVSIQGSVLGFDGSPLAAADVCVYVDATGSARGCTTSGSDGSFSVRTAANEEMIVTIRKDGFAPTLRAIGTILADSHGGQLAFFVTAPGAPPATAWVTRTAADSRAPLAFSVVLGRETSEL
jgi:hypothetical protein